MAPPLAYLFQVLSLLSCFFTTPSQAISITPHVQYSSSIGVLGCKIDTNHVAYFPSWPPCTNFCKKISYQGRERLLMHIDASAGAHDISYEAYNYLITGNSASAMPVKGGGADMDVTDVPDWMCARFLDEGNMPFAAASSMNTITACTINHSWIGTNYRLYNIMDPVCKWGSNEKCWLDGNGQPQCPSKLEVPKPLNLKVWNVEYGTGRKVLSK